MRRLSASCVLVCALYLVLFEAHPVYAQWVYNGVVISAAADYQMNSEIVSDGGDGAIIVWEDWRGTAIDIYAQKIDSWGYVKWTANGAPVCTADGVQMLPKVCTDGAGGAIVVFVDTYSGDYDLYAQRIDSYGMTVWAAPVAVTTALDLQYQAQICADGQGGAVIVWEDYQYANFDIMAQRIDADGNTPWGSTPVEVCVTSGDQTGPQIVPDGTGGFIIVWKDVRTGLEGIYAQKLESNGTRAWGTTGYACCTVTPTGLGNPRIVSDGYNGAIVTWYDERNTTDANIYAQRVGVDGDMMWGSDGTNVCIAAGDQLYPELVSDGDYGAIIAWRDGRVVDHDVYAQRLNANGVPRWIHNGKPVCTELGYQNQVQITTDGDHGAIIAWRDARLSSQFDLWAQRLDANGDPVWRVDGAQVCLDYPEDQTRPRLIPDTKGGALFCWDDNRANPYYDVYANRVERGGYYGYPSATITDVADVPADEGGWVDVTWTKSRLDEYGEPVVHYTVWRRLPDQTVALLLASGEKGVTNWRLDAAAAGPAYFFEETNGTTYGWEYIGDVGAARQASYTLTVPTLYDMSPGVDGTHYFKVIAHTEDEALFWESPEGSGYSVDNTAPAQTSGLSGEQSFSPPGLQLIWSSNTESDLLLYKIYRGVVIPAGSLEPNEETVIATTADTTYFDDEWRWYSDYYYKVAAVDYHGNEGPPSWLGPEEIVGVETRDIPFTSHLDQNYPNPFNPETTIRFGLHESAVVTLRIYDVSGRLVRELINEKRGAGTHKETWDGKNASGREVASGVYFYRLRAGGFDQSRKMILTR